MSALPEPVGSPEWQRDRLLAELDQRRTKVKVNEDYYLGNHPVPSPPERLSPAAFAEALRAYRNLARLGVTNWVKLVADAPSERLAVTGFRFGEEPEADPEAWLIWQRNHLDADSALVHDNALQTGQSFALVWADADGLATITPEHSSCMIVAYVPGSRRERAAALKSWVDDSGRKMVTLYTPDAVYKWQTRSSSPGYGEANGFGNAWEPRMPAGEEWPLKNPIGKVPVVELRANASLRPAPFGGGLAEFESVIPIQNRINRNVFGRLVTAEHQSFRQRWAIGWEPPRDANGQVDSAAVQRASQAGIWGFPQSPNDLKVGEFDQADFKGFLEADEADVRAMAAISQTPAYYLLGGIDNVSAEGVIASESGLVTKTVGHRNQFSEAWEEVMALALLVEDNPKADDVQTMAVWRSVEQRTWAQTVDAVVKMQGLGVPEEALWEMLPDVGPQDIARWRSMKNAAGLNALVDAEASVPPPVAPVAPL